VAAYGHVAVIDTSLRAVIATIETAESHFAVAPDSGRIYVAVPDENAISVIDASSLTVISIVPVGGFPRGIAVHPEGSAVYAANYDGTVSVIDTATNTVTATIPIEGQLNGIGVTPDGTKVYVAVNDGYVAVIDAASLAIVAKVPVGVNPTAFGEFIGGNAPPLRKLTVTKEGDGEGAVTSADGDIACGSDCFEEYWAGTRVTLLAEPATCRRFTGWSGACAGTNPTCEIVLNSDAAVTATFTGGIGLPSYDLTVTKPGDGEGTVTSTPSGIACGPSCTAPFLCTDSIILEAVPDAESVFSGWSGACSGPASTCSPLLTGDATATAVFTAKKASADYLPLIPGTSWTYMKNGTEVVQRKVLDKPVEVGGVETRAIQYVQEKVIEYLTSDAEGIILYRQYQPQVLVQGRRLNIDVTFSPPVTLAEGKMWVGQSVHSTGNAAVKAGIYKVGCSYSATTTVEAAEPITVTAGSFETMRVRQVVELCGYTFTTVRNLAKDVGVVKDSATDPEGRVVTAELLSMNGNFHDLAITEIVPPKLVTLKRGGMTKTVPVKVTIQNRSRHSEVIQNSGVLADLVTLSVTSLGPCTAPQPVLNPARLSRPFPISIPSKGNLSLYYDVAFTCANDPVQSTTRDPGHGDYTFSGAVRHTAIDGEEDDHRFDDACPRDVAPPGITDPFPDGNIKDKGCGTRKADGTFGGEIVLDVVVSNR
jgi:YVTN family beta-propeller protein